MTTRQALEYSTYVLLLIAAGLILVGALAGKSGPILFGAVLWILVLLYTLALIIHDNIKHYRKGQP